ncbi:hypothetical protein PILCRDRAFT_89870 [Piloderma croceum F 1598]|uniref:Uncharacterized protein n=1 Tax=Piloderma croceum (strain F 1598) TaxID=765440 RepID=A0A0C3B1F7_PILCF|nr:hypothetical protein PILCRDRAFT_89870 [Piloderma croceum F 1598]
MARLGQQSILRHNDSLFIPLKISVQLRPHHCLNTKTTSLGRLEEGHRNVGANIDGPQVIYARFPFLSVGWNGGSRVRSLQITVKVYTCAACVSTTVVSVFGMNEGKRNDSFFSLALLEFFAVQVYSMAQKVDILDLESTKQLWHMRWQTIAVSRMQVWAGNYEKFVFVKIGWAIRTIVRRRVEQLIKALADNGTGGAEMPIDGKKLVRRAGNLRRAGVWGRFVFLLADSWGMECTRAKTVEPRQDAILKISRKCHEQDVRFPGVNTEAAEAMEWAEPGHGGRPVQMRTDGNSSTPWHTSRARNAKGSVYLSCMSLFFGANIVGCSTEDRRNKCEVTSFKMKWLVHHDDTVMARPEATGDSNWWGTPSIYTMLCVSMQTQIAASGDS